MKAISVAGLALLLGAAPVFAITVTAEQGAGPESITAAPDGGLILGSATKPTIYRAAKGEAQAKPWIDASADGAVSFLGVMAETPPAIRYGLAELGQAAPRRAHRRPHPARLRSAPSAARRNRAGSCPASSIACAATSPSGPDHAAYVSDTGNNAIFRVRAGRRRKARYLHQCPADFRD